MPSQTLFYQLLIDIYIIYPDFSYNSPIAVFFTVVFYTD